MKKWLIAIITLILFGCATTGPISENEAFPTRNHDPRVGLIINNGQAHLNVYIYDQAGRLVEEIYFAGVNRHLQINNQNVSRYWMRLMEPGNYRIEIYPFYYKTDMVAPLFNNPGRYRIDLPKQSASIAVPRNPHNVYYGGRHWGWILHLNGGNIPATANGLPGIQMNFQGKIWDKLFGW